MYFLWSEVYKQGAFYLVLYIWWGYVPVAKRKFKLQGNKIVISLLDTQHSNWPKKPFKTSLPCRWLKSTADLPNTEEHMTNIVEFFFFLVLQTNYMAAHRHRKSQKWKKKNCLRPCSCLSAIAILKELVYSSCFGTNYGLWKQSQRIEFSHRGACSQTSLAAACLV